jgi:heme exporter protein B
MLMRLLRRELLRHWRTRQDLLNPLIFFLIVVSLFPLAVTPEGKLLQQMGPGVIFVAALLSTMLSLESMYRDDYVDGTLELLLQQSGRPLLVVSVKILAHWLMTAIPLVALSPVLGVMMHLQPDTIVALMVSLLLATPTLSLLGSVGMGLTVGLRQSGVLLSLLVLPLYIPVLIFGTSAVMAAAMGMTYSGQLALLGSMFFAAASLVPMASLAAIRVSIR